MSIETLIQTVLNYNPECDPEGLRRAYRFVEERLANKKLDSGVTYIQHALGTAMYLTRLQLDAEGITAALLHDVLQQSPAALESIHRNFGEETAGLVTGIARLTRVAWGDLGQGRAEDYRKLLLAMADDVRVALIWLAERLNEILSLGYLTPSLQKKRAAAALELYAPLANQLGIRTMKWEFEDKAFKVIEPENYRDLTDLMEERRDIRERRNHEIIGVLQTVLADIGIEAEISGRTKHIYSLYKKMKRTRRDFQEIYDVQGIRIIVATVPDCYAVLDAIHRIWAPIPGEFDDYIAKPKVNMYRSLHTAVSGPQQKPVEIQIRTHEMHRTAEIGIAAHWRYKDRVARDISTEAKAAFLRGVLAWQKGLAGSQVIAMPSAVRPFEKRVYVLTPKGDVIELAAGSTPLDFAYHIHSEVGHRCRGAKVNGKLVPVDTVLENGDCVDILTRKRPAPSRDWLNPHRRFTATTRARRDIRLWFQRQEREENISRGREALDRIMRRMGIRKKEYEKISLIFGYDQLDAFLEAVGRGVLSAEHVKTRLTEKAGEKEIPSEWSAPDTAAAVAPRVAVRGLKDLMTRVAGCCHPLPGHDIIGYITRGRGVTIHRRDCQNIQRHLGDQRLIEVDWGGEVQAYVVSIQVLGMGSRKILKDISEVVEAEASRIVASNVRSSRKDRLDVITTTLEIKSARQLNRILKKISCIHGVAEARRMMG